MNTVFKLWYVLLSAIALAPLAAGIAVVGGSLSAQAETIDTVSNGL